MDKLEKQAIQFFENEIYHYKIMLGGLLDDDYRQYIENKVQYYTIAINSINKNLCFDNNEEDKKYYTIEELLKLGQNRTMLKLLNLFINYTKKRKDITMKKIKIKYFTDIEKLKNIEGDKSDWIDLRSAEDVELKAREFKLIPLGVGMKLPKGYEAHIVPRSSTFKNFGIIQTNHQAVIDESYCGNDDQWRYPAYALRDTVIKKNDRICQFRIVEKMPKIEFAEVEYLEDNNRGGFGSTGV